MCLLSRLTVFSLPSRWVSLRHPVLKVLSEMTRVALYIPFPKGMTGAPRRTIALAEALRRQHLHVGIFGNPQTPFVQEAVKRGFEIVRFEHTRDLEAPVQFSP